jgi:GNAT superfamily N-acetyltransferase
MELFISFDGDNIGAAAGRALLNDDVAGVRKISASIEAGEDLWVNWAITAGGEKESAGGDEGCVKIPSDKVAEVEQIRQQYQDLVGASCSVGIGLKISEASKALMVAKLRGKDRIILWHPSMESELQAAQQKPQTEADKLSEHYLTDPVANPTLSKANEKGGGDALHDVGKNRGAHAGFAGHKRQGAASASVPHPTSEAQAVTDVIDQAKKESPPPEETHAAQDFEASLHDAAGQQEKSDTNTAVKDDQGLDQLKKKITQTLAQVKAQMPVMLQIKQSSPDAYQTIMNLVQGVIALGKEVMKGQPQVNDEDPQHVQDGLEKALKPLFQTKYTAPHIGANHFDEPDEHSLFTPQQRKQGQAQLVQAHGGHIPGVTNTGVETPTSEEGTVVAKPKLPKVAGMPKLPMAKEELDKSVLQIKPGPEIRDQNRKTFDYSHVLPEHAKAQGMKLHVSHIPGGKDTLTSTLYHNNDIKGDVTGYVRKGTKNIEPHSSLDPEYHGKGLGQAMYEAAYAHAKNVLGVTHVAGGIHSAQANALHTRLAAKHGFEYNPTPASKPVLAAGFSHGPYNYALKGEVPANVSDSDIIGPGKGVVFERRVAKDEMDAAPTAGDTVEKALGAKGGIVGKPTKQHLRLPVGSIQGNKIKVQHGPDKGGGVGWIEASSGLVQSQDPMSANTGGAGHPASSRKPSAQ